MKNKLIFRILPVAIILSLMMLALPLSPALAQETPTISALPASGAIGDWVTVTGSGFSSPGMQVEIHFGAIPVVGTTINVSGGFGLFGSVGFYVPVWATPGVNVISVLGISSATTNFTTQGVSAITLVPTSGTVGDTVSVSGVDFTPSSSVAITFDDIAVTTSPALINTDTLGNFTATFNVPPSIKGDHTVKAQDAAARNATATFTTGQKMSITPALGLVGTQVTVSGSGFNASSSVTITFDGTSVGTADAATDATGSFSATFTVPASASGAHTIKAQDNAGNFDTATFTMSGISITPTSGLVGDTVTVSGSGFAASSSATITFDGASLGVATTNTTGNFAATFIVPASANGTHTVKVQDSAGNFATATFTTGQQMSITPTSGLVGAQVTVSGSGFNASSSITITFDGTAVSVGTAVTDATGNFTATFTVPASASGAHTVKVQDSAGNFDTATFTTGQQMSITPTSGLVGAQVTVSGSGFSGPSTVIITFDGTSVDTATTNASGNFTATFTVPASANGAHTIRVQDGAGNFDTATFTTGQQMSITPTSGLVGAQVTVSGSGFGGSSNIDIYLDDVPIGVGVAIADVNGNFTGTFTIPVSSGGGHTIKAMDSDGNLAIVPLTVEPKMTVTPITGASGTKVTVSGIGFGAAKSVTITYNGEAMATISTDVSGSFSGSFSLPKSPAGSYTVVASDGTLSGSADFVAVHEAAISATSGNVGDEILVSGTGFKANTTVTVTYESEPVELATATTASNGSFSVAIIIPPSAGGAHTITATDGETTRQFAFDMEQEAPSTPQPSVIEDKPKQPLQFDWADVADPSLPLVYTLQIATDDEFTTLVLERTGLSESEYFITEEEKLELTKKESPYYWRVKAIDGASNESGWTSAGSFHVGGFAWPAIPDWVRYLLLGLGILAVVVIGFWLGIRTAYSSF